MSRSILLSLVFYFCTLPWGCAQAGTRVEGHIGGMSGVDIYAFRQEQLDSILSMNGKAPEARAFFSKLPLSDAVAHTKSGPYSSEYHLFLPAHGHFVITADAKQYLLPSDGQPVFDGQEDFWVVPVQTNGEQTLKVELTFDNEFGSKAANIVQPNVKNILLKH